MVAERGNCVLSAQSIFQEIYRDDESFRLFCSIAAKGEAQGGWENELIARLTPDAELAAKIARHGVDEEKHGRLFYALLKKRALDPVRVPLETDYCALLEAAGMGLAHERLGGHAPLSANETVLFLVHSCVTEQRAAAEFETRRRIFADDPALRNAIRLIAADESRHLGYCSDELSRFAKGGHAAAIDRTLRHYTRVEARVYRDVSLAVMRRMGEILGWSRGKRALLAARIHARYVWERLSRSPRLTDLRRKNAPKANALG